MIETHKSDFFLCYKNNENGKIMEELDDSNDFDYFFQLLANNNIKMARKYCSKMTAKDCYCCLGLIYMLVGKIIKELEILFFMGIEKKNINAMVNLAFYYQNI